jgi:WD40 repeat protein
VTTGTLDYLGRRLILGHHDGSVVVYNFSNGSVMERLAAPAEQVGLTPPEVTALMFMSPTPHSLHDVASASWGGKLAMYPAHDVPEHLASVIVQVGHRGDALCIEELPSGGIATGGSAGRVVVWHRSSGAVKGAAEMPKPGGGGGGNKSGAASAASSRSRSKSVEGGGKKTDGTEPLETDGTEGHGNNAVEKLLHLRGRGVLLAGMNDGRIIACDPENGTPFSRCAVTMGSTISGLEVDLRVQYVMATDTSGAATIWNVGSVAGRRALNFQPVRSWQAHECEITTLCVMNAPSLFATGTVNGEVRLWSYSGELTASLGAEWPKKLPHVNGPVSQLDQEHSAKVEALYESRRLRFS